MGLKTYKLQRSINNSVSFMICLISANLWYFIITGFQSTILVLKYLNILTMYALRQNVSVAVKQYNIEF